jgi:hypothetical protein
VIIYDEVYRGYVIYVQEAGGRWGVAAIGPGMGEPEWFRDIGAARSWVDERQECRAEEGCRQAEGGDR